LRMQLDPQSLPAKLSGPGVCFKGAEAIEHFRYSCGAAEIFSGTTLPLRKPR
jgi:hypothetical protein